MKKEPKYTKEKIQIGENLIKYRKQNHKTQEDIAKLLKITRQAYSKIERGEANLTYDKANTLADYYKIPVSMLIKNDTAVDVVLFDEIEIYKEASEYPGLGVPSYVKRYFFERQKIKNKEGKDIIRTYRVDDGIRGIPAVDLYAVEITNEKNPLNAPIGSKVIIQHVNENTVPEINKPIYMVLEWENVLSTDDNYPDYDRYLAKHPLFNEFITLVTPLQGLNKSLQVDRRFRMFYKFTFPNGNEYYAPLEEIKKMAKGIVKKVIIDY